MGYRYWRGICLLCLGILAPPVIFAQRYSFKYYTQEQGLEDLTVSCLFQDHSGFLWLGTMNGLFRYDGEHFESVNGLPSTRVISLAETPEGRLLVATREGLVMREGEKTPSQSSCGEGRLVRWRDVSRDTKKTKPAAGAVNISVASSVFSSIAPPLLSLC